MGILVIGFTSLFTLTCTVGEVIVVTVLISSKNWIQTDSIVIDLIYSERSNTNRRHNNNYALTSSGWIPIVEYEDVNGNKFKDQYPTKINTANKPEIGSTIRVKYNPKKPSQSRFVGLTYAGEVIGMTIGFIFSVSVLVGLIIAVSNGAIPAI